MSTSRSPDCEDASPKCAGARSFTRDSPGQQFLPRGHGRADRKSARRKFDARGLRCLGDRPVLLAACPDNQRMLAAPNAKPAPAAAFTPLSALPGPSQIMSFLSALSAAQNRIVLGGQRRRPATPERLSRYGSVTHIATTMRAQQPLPRIVSGPIRVPPHNDTTAA